jgi:hypothetical protein
LRSGGEEEEDDDDEDASEETEDEDDDEGKGQNSYNILGVPRQAVAKAALPSRQRARAFLCN